MIRPVAAVGFLLSGVLAADTSTFTGNMWDEAAKYGLVGLLLLLVLWWSREDRKNQDRREEERIARSDARWDETNKKQFEIHERTLQMNASIAKTIEVSDAKRLDAIHEQTRTLQELSDALRGRPCLAKETEKKGV